MTPMRPRARRQGEGRGDGIIDGGGDDGAYRHQIRRPPLMTRGMNAMFAFVQLAEFEILFFVFWMVAFVLFKDLTSRPEYNQIFVKKLDGLWSQYY